MFLTQSRCLYAISWERGGLKARVVLLWGNGSDARSFLSVLIYQ